MAQIHVCDCCGSGTNVSEAVMASTGVSEIAAIPDYQGPPWALDLCESCRVALHFKWMELSSSV